MWALNYYSILYDRALKDGPPPRQAIDCKEHTEKVGFGLWSRRLLNFLSRSDGGSCPNKKNSGMTKLLFRDAQFLSNRDRVLSGISSL